MNDTIVALASAAGRAGVAVVRVSGPHARMAAAAVGAENLADRVMARVHLRVGDVGLDEGMAVFFEGPRSFTGEDVVEIFPHGSMPVVEALLAALVRVPHVRAARAGEFTRRAVENGKMDMTQAEGLADLIEAQTEAQRRQALRQLNGALGVQFERWRTGVMEILAQVEAAIDFPDEELEIVAAERLTEKVRVVMGELQGALGERAGERVREGMRLAIVGEPNAGKSTLLNLLAGRKAAIVSDRAGTTRDVVAVGMDVGGYVLTVADTAGLREDSDDPIEAEGMELALGEAESADVLVVVMPAARFGTRQQLPPALEPLLAPGRTLVVVSKADTVEGDFASAVRLGEEVYPLVAVNLTEPEALGRVEGALRPLLANLAGASEEAALLTRKRHRTAVQEALAALGRALVGMQTGGQAELVAQDLRDAAAAIGEVTGRTGSEDVLDLVFSTFCIGK